MRVVITGSSGFVGNLLAEEILEDGSFGGEALTGLVMVDRMLRPAAWDGDPRVTSVTGELQDVLPEVFEQPVDAVVHLAAAVSAECERDFDLGMRANLQSTWSLLEAARTQQVSGGPRALVVFASSVAVYGTEPQLTPPAQVTEADLPLPASSYGMQKAVCEQLVTDYTRKGFLDGRVVRLMTVAIRPGVPNAAASGFLSGIVREPLKGVAAVCPVDASLQVALASPRSTVRGLLTVARAARGEGPGELAGRLPVNLPAITVSVGQMLATLREVAGDDVADLVTIEPDAAIETIVGSWPARFDNTRATALGVTGDESFEAVVRQYIADYVPGQAVRQT